MLISSLVALMQADLSKLCHTSRNLKKKKMPVCSLLLCTLLFFFLFKKKFVRYDDLCESARFILADLAANSYLLGLRDMFCIWDVSLLIICLLS